MWECGIESLLKRRLVHVDVKLPCLLCFTPTLVGVWMLGPSARPNPGMASVQVMDFQSSTGSCYRPGKILYSMTFAFELLAIFPVRLPGAKVLGLSTLVFGIAVTPAKLKNAAAMRRDTSSIIGLPQCHSVANVSMVSEIC